jgi:hypothetical protein
MLVIIGFTVFLHSVRSASSLAVPQGCNKSRETTTQLFTTNRQLDELILPLSNPTVQPLPGPGFCNELYRIKDAENNEVSLHFASKHFRVARQNTRLYPRSNLTSCFSPVRM